MSNQEKETFRYSKNKRDFCIDMKNLSDEIELKKNLKNQHKVQSKIKYSLPEKDLKY